MAEDKLGTLQYDMLIDEEKLTNQLQNIDKLLKIQDDKWKEMLSSVGGSGGSKAIVETQNAIVNLTKAQNQQATSGAKVAKDGMSFAVQQYEIEQKILALKKELNREALKTRTKERDLIPTGELSKMAALAREIRQETVRLNEIKSKIVAQSLPNKLGGGTVDFQGYINGLTQVPLQLQKMNQEYAEMEKESNRILEIERKKTAELAKQAERLSKLNEKQRIERSKLEFQVKQPTTNPIAALDAEYALLKFDVKNAKYGSDISDLTKKIIDNRSARKQLIATIKEQTQIERANQQQQKLKAAVVAQEVGSIARLRAEYALLAFQYGQVGKTIPFTTDNVKQLTTAMAQNRAQMAQLQPTLGMWGKLVSAIRTYATAYLSVQAVMGLGRAVFTQTKELDQLEFSMRTVIKSSTELAQTQKFLSEVAINYGGDLLTLSERYIKFRAAALQSNMSAAETQKIYDSVSKAAGTLGLKTDELSGVYLALEQMISKGKVTTEELRRQLGERLPGAFGIMANALGVTIPQLDKMLKKGEVLSKDALPKFAAALEKAYGLESVKKIDTLAAAQGRMSTQFTMLIKEIGASEGFKGLINGIANFLGFLKNNLDVIGFFAKAILAVSGALLLYKTRLIAIGAYQFIMIAFTNNQSIATNRLSASMLANAMAINTATRSWKAFGLALKANAVGLIVSGVALLVTWLISLRKKSKDASEATLEFSEQVIKAKKNIDFLFDSMNKSTQESNRFKNAIAQINFQLAKYNIELITSKSTVDELTEAHKKLKTALVEEMFIKERSSRIDAATAEYSKVQTDVVAAFADKQLFDPTKQQDAYSMMLDLAEDATLTFQEKVTKIIDEFGLESATFVDQLLKLEKAAKKFNSEIENINTNLPEIKQPEILDISGLTEQFKNAKEEFEKVAKIGAEAMTEITYFDAEKGIKTYKDYLNSLLEEYKKSTYDMRSFGAFEIAKPDIESNLDNYFKYLNELDANDKIRAKAREQILLEIADIEKKATGGGDRKDPYEKLLEKRNEAIDELNKKYIQDKEDFVNADLGISAGRIAALEDGIIKEQRLNQLSYENRIKAINKEREAGLKLVNDIAGTEKKPLITSLGFDATGYSQEVQNALANLLETDTEKRANATRELTERNLAIVVEFEDKISEIQRDVNDEFLKGVEKEKAAIKEKYDDWAKRAKLADPLNTDIQAEIEEGRQTANAEVDRRFRLDELEFFREIEYKKNEIAYGASLNRRKLDKANFDTYVKYERQKIAELRSSALNDNKILADQKELELSTDIDLENTKRKVELQKDIIEAGKELTSILKEQLDLTDEQAKAFDSIVSAISQFASGNYVGAALSGLIAAASIMLDDSKVAERLSKPWEEFENWVVRSNAALQRYIDLRDEAIGAERFSSSSLVIEKIANDIKEAEKILSESKLSLAFEATGWPANAWDDLKKQVAEAGKELGGTLEKASENAFSLGVWAKVKQTWTFDLDQLLFSETGEFTLTKINELIDEGIITDAKVIEAVKNYETLVGQLAEAEKQKQELLTATMASNIADSISEGFRNGLDSAADFADTFEEYIRGAIDNALKILSEPAFKKWYEDLAAAMESGGGLDKDEIAKLKLDWDSLIQIEKQRRDATYELTGLSTYTGDSIDSGMYKGIQGVQEATARRLEGLINTIRETGVKNLDNARELLLSSQMIQAYSGQSLAKLTNIDSNIALQLALFNGIMTTASGVGGAGLKVYIQ